MENNGIHSKFYYSIGEVAKMFEVNTSLIRFYEKEFDIIKPKKNRKGDRFFTPADIDNFHLIFHLVKERGYTLEGARNKLSAGQPDLNRDLEIVKTLDQMRDFLLDLKKNL
jgi:DNA-binding transcriptional MerR regulator